MLREAEPLLICLLIIELGMMALPLDSLSQRLVGESRRPIYCFDMYCIVRTTVVGGVYVFLLLHLYLRTCRSNLV